MHSLLCRPKKLPQAKWIQTKKPLTTATVRRSLQKFWSDKVALTECCFLHSAMSTMMSKLDNDCRKICPTVTLLTLSVSSYPAQATVRMMTTLSWKMCWVLSCETARALDVMQLFTEKRGLMDTLAFHLDGFETTITAARPPRWQTKAADFLRPISTK